MAARRSFRDTAPTSACSSVKCKNSDILLVREQISRMSLYTCQSNSAIFLAYVEKRYHSIERIDTSNSAVKIYLRHLESLKVTISTVYDGNRRSPCEDSEARAPKTTVLSGFHRIPSRDETIWPSAGAANPRLLLGTISR